MDPPGLRLENFDVFGGWRDRYRAVGKGTPEKGLGKNGQKFAFHAGCLSMLRANCPTEGNSRTFASSRTSCSKDDKQIARNLARQLIVYGTGAPVRFSDRPQVEKILERASSSHYGVRSLIHEIVQSEFFLNK